VRGRRRQSAEVEPPRCTADRPARTSAWRASSHQEAGRPLPNRRSAWPHKSVWLPSLTQAAPMCSLLWVCTCGRAIAKVYMPNCGSCSVTVCAVAIGAPVLLVLSNFCHCQPELQACAQACCTPVAVAPQQQRSAAFVHCLVVGSRIASWQGCRSLPSCLHVPDASGHAHLPSHVHAHQPQPCQQTRRWQASSAGNAQVRNKHHRWPLAWQQVLAMLGMLPELSPSVRLPGSGLHLLLSAQMLGVPHCSCCCGCGGDSSICAAAMSR
jgi:hypothetical protein